VASLVMWSLALVPVSLASLMVGVASMITLLSMSLLGQDQDAMRGTIDASLATSAPVLGGEIPEAPRPGLGHGDSTLDWSDNLSPRRRSITASGACGACGACDAAYVPGVLSFRLRMSFSSAEGLRRQGLRRHRGVRHAECIESTRKPWAARGTGGALNQKPG